MCSFQGTAIVHFGRPVAAGTVKCCTFIEGDQAGIMATFLGLLVVLQGQLVVSSLKRGIALPRQLVGLQRGRGTRDEHAEGKEPQSLTMLRHGTSGASRVFSVS